MSSSERTITSVSDGQASHTRAYLALIAGTFTISFNGIFTQLASTNGDVAGFYRLGIAALVLTIPALINRRRGGMRLPREAWWLVGLAGIAIAWDLAMWNNAVNLIGAGMATVLGNTAPLWVSLGAWLIFREKLGRWYWVGLAVALSGAVIIVGLDAIEGLDRGLGNILGLLTGIAYAVYQLVTHRARVFIDTLTYMWIFSGVGAALLLGLSLMSGHPLVGLPTETYLWLLCMALISHLGGWSLINYAFGHLPVSLVTVTLLGQPVLTTLFESIIFRTMPEAWQIGGGLIVLAGIYIVHRNNAPSRAIEVE